MVNHSQRDMGSVSGHAMGSHGEEHNLQSVFLVQFRPGPSWNGVSHVVCHATMLHVIVPVPPEQSVSQQRQDFVQNLSRAPGLCERLNVDLVQGTYSQNVIQFPSHTPIYVCWCSGWLESPRPPACG